ncbi:hypothetical protein QKW52_02230 [Bacillus sonorensis]|nr:hypothetical protein [Bacillus sonorensis]
MKVRHYYLRCCLAVFDQLPFGMLFFIGFLIAFLFAALTSAFSMIEIIVAAITKGDDTGRRKWTWAIGLLIFIVGIPACLSYGVLDKLSDLRQNVFRCGGLRCQQYPSAFGSALNVAFHSFKIVEKDLYDEMKSGSRAGKGFFLYGFIFSAFLFRLPLCLSF